MKQEEKDFINQTKEVVSSTWEKTKEFTKEAYNSAKEFAQDSWEIAQEEMEKYSKAIEKEEEKHKGKRIEDRLCRYNLFSFLAYCQYNRHDTYRVNHRKQHDEGTQELV